MPNLEDAPGMDGPRDGGLPQNAKQEHFGLAFVHMVAYAAGCSIKCHETDYDGVDITITASAEYARYYCPEVELQLKCTTQHRYLREDHMAWPMEADAFGKLTHPKRMAPAYLGVLLIPEDPEAWLKMDEQGLFTESRLYWQRASDIGPVSEGRGSRTVRLPRSNMLDVPQLRRIMEMVGTGGTW